MVNRFFKSWWLNSTVKFSLCNKWWGLKRMKLVPYLLHTWRWIENTQERWKKEVQVSKCHQNTVHFKKEAWNWKQIGSITISNANFTFKCNVPLRTEINPWITNSQAAYLGHRPWRLAELVQSLTGLFISYATRI